ncbi:hypothetical protein DM860_016835 [Cuscuta australis]|uniref:Protein FLX-like 3 n=1 Tax=Cuscuta australis TaxID=267555 RepID=A0A328CZ55_9ASTE|nr:hypothetical protein DM860_016835 [Cuscuta australis]
MSGRSRLPPRQPDNFKGYRDGPTPLQPVMQRGPPPLPPHPAALEEELEIQRRDMESILAENRYILDENVMLERELTATKDKIIRFSQSISKLHADNEAEAREYIDRELKLETELHSAEPLRAEVGSLRNELQTLTALQNELSTQVQSLTKDLNKLHSENKKLSAMKAEVDEMHKELDGARRELEHEKKENKELMVQNKAMQNDFFSMVRELETLRTEQMAAERKARGIGVGPYGMLSGSLDVGYPGSLYSDPYNSGAWGPNGRRGPPRH